MPAATPCSGKSKLERKSCMSDIRKRGGSRPDADNPEWTRKDMAKARPAAEVLPGLIGAKATAELFRRGRGRPPRATRKVNQTIRLDSDVPAAYRQEGRSWRTLINTVLREHRHEP